MPLKMPAAPKSDRAELRRGFLAAHRWDDAEALPLRPDASFRRYLRLRRERDTVMLMDAPPAVEDVAAFVTVTRHLQKLGARVPAIYGVDGDNGFLLLEDLGDQTFTRLLAEGHHQTPLYRQAVDTLGRIRRHPQSVAVALPGYTAKSALAEANLFLEWYLPARLERSVSAAARTAFGQIWKHALSALPPLAPTLVLRDYHVDNLMLVDGRCAVLDYQDARIGSPAYDLASLLEDARRDVAPAFGEALLEFYLRENPDLDRRGFRQHYEVWAAQRHCKVAGIFVRLWLRDGKDAYLRHLPRVMGLLQRHLHEPALAPLRDWLGDHPGALDHTAMEAPPAHLLRHCNTR